MTHTPLPPFSAWSGPRNARVVFIGEAWGADEDEARRPLVGSSGKEFWRMLGETSTVALDLHYEALKWHRYGLAWVPHREAWMEAASIAFTNVLNFRPPNNQIPSVSVTKEFASGRSLALGPISKKGKQLFLRDEFLCERDRLFEELLECKAAGGCNLLVPMGNTATWAVLASLAIGSIRGGVCLAVSELEGLKALPTFHPAGVLYDWAVRAIICQDLLKVWREGGFPELRLPRREIIVNPTLQEIRDWTEWTLAFRPKRLGLDTETQLMQIQMISFAHSRREGIVIPFIDHSKPGWNYWQREEDESEAWHHVRALLESGIPIVGQNLLYDLQYIRAMKINPRRFGDDTMLKHHSHYPELRKGLGFLGSIYTDEASWKMMMRGERQKSIRRIKRGKVAQVHFGVKRDG